MLKLALGRWPSRSAAKGCHGATLVLIALTLGWAAPAGAQDVVGSGSTFAFPVVAKWAAAFEQAGGPHVAYQPVGSTRGLQDIGGARVDFGITDAPLVDAQLLRDGLLQFPLVIGAIVPVVNLDGVKPGELHLTGGVLADIYLGKIKHWRDPAILALNANIALPNLPILPVYRSDGSGTTFNWADFLSKASQLWRAQVGTGPTVEWPTGAAGQGNRGVTEKVARVPGAIGYVEYSYAISHGLSYSLVQNHAGAFVPPQAAAFLAATQGVDWSAESDFAVLLTDSPNPDAYPIVATSFVVMRRTVPDMDRRNRAMRFFQWSLQHGQEIAASLGYLPLPDTLVAQIDSYWRSQFQGMAP